MIHFNKNKWSYIGACVVFCLFIGCFIFGYLYLEKANSETIVVQFYASREKVTWIAQAAKEFNDQKHKVDEKFIVVQVLSEESLKMIKSGFLKPELWSPGDSEALAHTSIAWDEKTGTPIFSDVKLLVYVQDPMGKFWVEQFVMILKSSFTTEEKAVAAELFVEFLLSLQGQQLASQSGLKPLINLLE
jgi:hypothetical protein